MKPRARINTSVGIIGVVACVVAARAAADSPVPYMPTMDAAMTMTATLPPPQPMDMVTPMTTPMMKDGMTKGEMTNGAAQRQKYMHAMLLKEQLAIDGGNKISP